MPLPSQRNFGNVISFQMRQVEIRKLRTAKRTVRWSLRLLAFGIVEQQQQFTVGIKNHESVDHAEIGVRSYN